MNNTDLITVLAKLLTNKTLRKIFAKSPKALADELGINEDDYPHFLEIDVEQLELQAKTLQSKRFHEVRKLIPQTTYQLNDKAYEYFLDYSENHWPEGINRHSLDAHAFINYLKKIKVKISKDEYNRLLFAMKRKKLLVSFLDRVKIRGQFRSAIQVIIKISSKRYEWCLYLGI